MRILATKNFMRFAKKFGAARGDLLAALQQAPDADLGGGVFKYRIAREGEGTSGGGRAIVAVKAASLVVLMYGFEKKDLANIRQDELRAFKAAAKVYFSLKDDVLNDLVIAGTLFEVMNDEE